MVNASFFPLFRGFLEEEEEEEEERPTPTADVYSQTMACRKY
jgi:hypothetical protein